MSRKLHPKLKEYILKKLKGHGAAEEIIKLKDKKRARELLMYVAESLVGIYEIPRNSNTGPIVKLIQTITGSSESSVSPWCMRFIQACIAFVEDALDIKSEIYASGSCWSVWIKSPKKLRVKNYPARGAIIIWQNGDGINQGSSGHTGFVAEWSDGQRLAKYMYTIEGNTGKGVTSSGDIISEGDGVYFNKRSVEYHNGKRSSKQKIVGFLKPF